VARIFKLEEMEETAESVKIISSKLNFFPYHLDFIYNFFHNGVGKILKEDEEGEI